LVREAFEDETINAYEIGYKADLLSGSVRTNVAAFYYDYTNLQFQASDFNEFGSGVSNIPKSEIYGLEFEMTALLGNELAKTPGLTADITLAYENQLSSGAYVVASLQYTHRGDFEQRVFNNPEVDDVDAYNLFNANVSYDSPDESWGADLMVYNITDQDGVNSSMTDVFGVNETGFQYIPPRMIMGRLRFAF
jgi:iron complex outermembrane receptor protein